MARTGLTSRRPGSDRLLTAVVVASGSVGALAAIRSLGRRGVHVLAVDSSPRALGLRSRFAEPRLVPDPTDDERGFVDGLIEIAAELGRPVPLFAVSDRHLDAIARNHMRLWHLFRFPLADGTALLRLREKNVQAEIANATGVPTPRTTSTPTGDLRFPVVVKATDSAAFVRAFSVKGFRCDSASELEDVLVRTRGLAPIVQEWIPGPDENLHLVGACLSRGGHVLGVVTARKLEQIPPEIGTIRVGEARPAPAVAALAVKFLQAARCYGPSDVEFKLDPRDGEFKFIEVNPRVVQWQGLAAAAGVDLVRLSFEDLMGLVPEPVVQSPRPTRWAMTFLTGSGHERSGLSGSGPSFARLPYADAVFAADDPWPSFVQLSRVAGGFLRRPRP